MPKKILLADDSITIQKVVELTFSDGDYEVTAVNNGAKAVQKLSEMRPDIILSDIIMPEKNGYEVCEYVKSHPDFRNIPVVLLTGTFEPFDPDRAEKAGCDAVVTKPFESQSLIHKVEELIAQSASAAPAVAAEPEPEAASPWMEEPAAPVASPLGTGVFTPAAAAADSFTHDEDIFSAPVSPEATTEMPFETPAGTPFEAPTAAETFSSETRAFPRMSFDDLPQPGPASEPMSEPMSSPEPPSWPLASESPVSEVPAWPDASAEEPATPPPPAFASLETPMPSSSPFEEPPAGGETRSFPKMSFDDFPPTAPIEPVAEPVAQPESMSWNAPEPPAFEEETPAFGGETRAFPKMSFDDFQTPPAAPEASGWDAAPEAPAWSQPEAPAFEEPPAFTSEPSAFASEPGAFESESAPLESESPAFSAETSAFPKMSFDDFQTPAASFDEPQPMPEVESEPVIEDEPAPAEAAAEPLPWDEAPAAESEAFWSPASERPSIAPAADDSFSAPQPFAAPAQEELPSTYDDAAEETAIESEPEADEQPEWAAAMGAAASAEAAADEEEPVVPPPALAPEAPAMPIAAHSGDLTDEQVDRIARRVVELMSEKVVRNIAWEVIPDMAEMVVKERIRQLEAEA
jgi:CheY-like chemotaxis protein